MPTEIYAPPTANDTVGFFEIMSYINTTAGGLFFPVILLVVWLITFISSLLTSGVYSGRSAAGGWTFASFITFVLAMPLSIMGVLDPKYMYLTVIFMAVGIVWVYLADSRN